MVRYGIIGAGKIAHRFADSLSREGDELYAISGRSIRKMEAFAKEHPCQKVYLSHEELIEDPEVEAVYLSLPNFMHAEWACKAMRHGKAVLCEKPAALNEAEMNEIRSVSEDSHMLFMEAMKNRFTPAFHRAVWLLDSGAIGELKSILVRNGFVLAKERYGTSYITNPEQGGGCLLDIGCYGVSWLQKYLGNDLRIIRTEIRRGPSEMYVNSRMEGNGIDGRLIVAFDQSIPSQAVFTGTSGILEVFPMHRPDHIRLNTAKGTWEESIPYEGDDFSGEIRHFDRLIAEKASGSDQMSLDDSIACARILDRIRASFPE